MTTNTIENNSASQLIGDEDADSPTNQGRWWNRQSGVKALFIFITVGSALWVGYIVGYWFGMTAFFGILLDIVWPLFGMALAYWPYRCGDKVWAVALFFLALLLSPLGDALKL
jgi:hypothetical protein